MRQARPFRESKNQAQTSETVVVSGCAACKLVEREGVVGRRAAAARRCWSASGLSTVAGEEVPLRGGGTRPCRRPTRRSPAKGGRRAPAERPCVRASADRRAPSAAPERTAASTAFIMSEPFDRHQAAMLGSVVGADTWTLVVGWIATEPPDAPAAGAVAAQHRAEGARFGRRHDELVVVDESQHVLRHLPHADVGRGDRARHAGDRRLGRRGRTGRERPHQRREEAEHAREGSRRPTTGSSGPSPRPARPSTRRRRLPRRPSAPRRRPWSRPSSSSRR